MNYSNLDCTAMNKSQPFDSEVDSGKSLCFLSKLENDLQLIFDHLCSKFTSKDTHIKCRELLKKGNFFQNGDFFLSLRSNRLFFMPGVKEELQYHLKEIPYILENVIDDSGNLILCLNRSVLFRNVLQDVTKYEDKYGVKTSAKSYLILVHNEVFSDFDALRLAFVANNVISFLVATGAKVVANEFRKHPELSFKKVPIYTCTDACLQEIKVIYELIDNTANSCGQHGNEWISVPDQEGISVDLKKFAKYHSLSYEKDVDNIIIKNKPSIILNQAAFTLHFNFFHEAKPDHIIHICLQNEKRKIIESGILLEMLQLIDISQTYITCQNIHSKAESECEVTVDNYINFQKVEIENAMKEKYSSDELKNEKWDIYFKNLIDTSLKFSFLQAGTNDPLKLDLSLNQKVTSKSKNGIFIQYNFARLSNIFKKFDSKVKEGYYKELPVLDSIDFGLLKFEEEWNLLNFVLSFPRLVEEISLSINSKCFFPVNKLQLMLTKLCHSFSKYYSRIHILGGQQPQLQKIMHARLWLLKGVWQILYNSFVLLNIEGLNEM